MFKRLFKCLYILSFSFMLALSSCSAEKDETSNPGSSSETINSTPLISSQPSEQIDIEIDDFIKNNDCFYEKVNNDIDTFSFIGKVHFSSEATWRLYSDIKGNNEIVTKTTDLDIGDNVFYIFLFKETESLAFYKVTIRRLPIYTVTFDTDGGTSIPSQSVQEGSLIDNVAEPSKLGYSFVSWDYDFEKPIIDDLIVKASYVANEYTITYDVNGGDELPDATQKVYYDMYYSLVEPNKNGYSFGGWFDGDNLVSNGIWNYLTSKTLKAYWMLNHYSIVYNLGIGATNNPSNPSSYTFFDSIVLGNPSRDYYNFERWTDNNNNTITSIPQGSRGNVNLTAVWSPIQYPIIYHLNDGINNASNPSYYTYETPTITLNEPQKDGYTFEGWYTTPSFDSSTIVDTIPTNSYGQIDLWAKWNANQYNIYFNTPSTAAPFNVYFNDGLGNVTSQEVVPGQQIDLPIPETFKEHCAFSGWTYTQNGNLFVNDGTILQDTTTLYAKWESLSRNNGNGYYIYPGFTYHADDIHSCTMQIPYPCHQPVFVNCPWNGVYTLRVKVNNIYNSNIYWDDGQTTAFNKTNDSASTYIYTKTFTISGNSQRYHWFYFAPIELGVSVPIYLLDVSLTCSVEQARISLSNIPVSHCVSLTYDSSYNLGIPSIVPTDCEFVGWFTGENGDGTQLTNNTGDSLSSWNIAEEIIVYPYFVSV